MQSFLSVRASQLDLGRSFFFSAFSGSFESAVQVMCEDEARMIGELSRFLLREVAYDELLNHGGRCVRVSMEDKSC